MKVVCSRIGTFFFLFKSDVYFAKSVTIVASSSIFRRKFTEFRLRYFPNGKTPNFSLPKLVLDKNRRINSTFTKIPLHKRLFFCQFWNWCKRHFCLVIFFGTSEGHLPQHLCGGISGNALARSHRALWSCRKKRFCHPRPSPDCSTSTPSEAPLRQGAMAGVDNAPPRRVKVPQWLVHELSSRNEWPVTSDVRPTRSRTFLRLF